MSKNTLTAPLSDAIHEQLLEFLRLNPMSMYMISKLMDISHVTMAKILRKEPIHLRTSLVVENFLNVYGGCQVGVAHIKIKKTDEKKILFKHTKNHE